MARQRFLGLKWTEWRFWLGWVLASAVAWTVAEVTRDASMADWAWYVEYAVGGAVGGSITGAALIVHLRHPLEEDGEAGN